jgi:hypothetical protein
MQKAIRQLADRIDLQFSIFPPKADQPLADISQFSINLHLVNDTIFK